MVEREGSSLPYYGGVLLDELVVSYTLNLPTGTDLEEAKAMVLREFPDGSRFAKVDDDQSTCLIVTVASPRVQAAMNKGGWRNWIPAAVFGTSTATKARLDHSEVTDVTMVPVEPGRDFGSC